MNITRLILAAAAATIVDFLYGFIVYGNLLTTSFLAQGGIYRSAEAQMAYMPMGAGGIFLAMLAAAALFAWSRRRGVADGLRLGALLALFAIGSAVVVNYATINMSADHAARMIAATLGEWLLVGVVIGLVYRAD